MVQIIKVEIRKKKPRRKPIKIVNKVRFFRTPQGALKLGFEKVLKYLK